MIRSRSDSVRWATILLAVVVGSATAQTSVDTTARVDSVFARFNRTDAPGCVCGVIRDGEEVFAKGYGMANLELDVPLSPNSVIFIASTSKQFTAASIALLALQGKLDLDASIHTYLPEMGDLGARVTVRQLVHHTSGVRDYIELRHLAGWAGKDYFNNERVYQLLTQQKALNFEPGSRYLYSNSNYVLLAEIVERVSGQSLREFADANIFAPLGMAHTHFEDDYRQIVKNRATSYQFRQGAGGLERMPKSFDGYGDMGLLTTIGDLVKWDANFYDPKVGGDEFLELIHTRGVLDDGDVLDYAFGLEHGSHPGLAAIVATGSFKGFRSALLRFPMQRFSVVVLCNFDAASAGWLAQRVADIYLAPVLEPESTAITSRDSVVELSDTELQRFIGHYWDPDLLVARRIAMRNGALALGPVPGTRMYRLAAIDDHTLVVQDVPVHVELVFDHEARRFTLTQGGGEPSVMEWYEPASPTETELDAYVGTYVSDEGLADLRVTREGETLIIHILHQEPERLRPSMADHFTWEWHSIAFDQSSGRVSGLTVEMGHIRGVRFDKRD